jgi:hypothetical protein
VYQLGAEERCHHEGVSPWLWNVVGVVRSVVRDGCLGPPEVRGHDQLGVVDFLQDALVLAPRRASQHPAEDHHDDTIFLGNLTWSTFLTTLTLATPSPCSFGLSATSQQYFSLRTNHPSVTS